MKGVFCFNSKEKNQEKRQKYKNITKKNSTAQQPSLITTKKMAKRKKSQQQQHQQAAPITEQEKRDLEYAKKLQAEADKEDSTDDSVDDGWSTVGPKDKNAVKRQRKAARDLEDKRLAEQAEKHRLAEEKARREQMKKAEEEAQRKEAKKQREAEKKRMMEELKRKEEEMKRREEEMKEIEKGDHTMALELQKKLDEEEKKRLEEVAAADEAAGWTMTGAKGKERKRQKKKAELNEEIKAEKAERQKVIEEQKQLQLEQKKQQQQQQQQQQQTPTISKSKKNKNRKKKAAAAAAAKEGEEGKTSGNAQQKKKEGTEEGSDGKEKKKDEPFISWADTVKTHGKCTTYSGVGSVEYKPTENELMRESAPFLPSYILQPCGFVNRGNKCYFNAVVQVLFASALFREMIGKARDLRERVADARELAKIPLLQKFIVLIQSFPTFPLTSFEKNNFTPMLASRPSDLKDLQKVVLPEFLRGVGGAAAVAALENEQQDAQELFSYILDTLHEEFIVLDGIVKVSSDGPKKEKEGGDENGEGTANEDDDGGEWMTKIKGKSATICSQVNTFGTSPVNDLFAGTVRSILDKKSTRETSVNVQPFYTLQLDINDSRVNSIEDAIKLYQTSEYIDDSDGMCKTNKIETAPKILCLHLKRFIFEDKPFPIKCSKPVVFKKTLGLAGKGYTLSAVIRHHGATAIKGHYTCDVLCLNRFWLHCNDASLEWVDSVDDVLEQNQDTYMLFYVTTN